MISIKKDSKLTNEIIFMFQSPPSPLNIERFLGGSRMVRGCSLFLGGGGSEDFWGAMKLFLEIQGGHEGFFRNFGGP